MSQLLRTGELSRLVSMQSRSAAQDTFGEQLATWTEIKKVYAKIEALSGRELTAAQGAWSEVTHRFTLHYDDAFSDPRTVAAMRVVYGARVFNIGALMNIDEDNRVLELLAQEGLNDG